MPLLKLTPVQANVACTGPCQAFGTKGLSFQQQVVLLF